VRLPALFLAAAGWLSAETPARVQVCDLAARPSDFAGKMIWVHGTCGSHLRNSPL
jgi:hypothetical protein